MTRNCFFDKKKGSHTFDKKDKFKSNKFSGQRFKNNQVNITTPGNDYEKRKLAEQRATKRLKEETAKEFKGINKIAKITSFFNKILTAVCFTV